MILDGFVFQAAIELVLFEFVWLALIALAELFDLYGFLGGAYRAIDSLPLCKIVIVLSLSLCGLLALLAEFFDISLHEVHSFAYERYCK